MIKTTSKMPSILSMPVRVKKKGKTRGRPSKGEIWASQVASDLLKKHQPEINKAIADTIIYGQGTLKIDGETVQHFKFEDFFDPNKIPERKL